MARQVITKTVTLAGSGYNNPPRTLYAGTIVELSAAELAALTGAGMTARVTAYRDQLGLAVGVSNSN
jgi:hypothetical protein